MRCERRFCIGFPRFFAPAQYGVKLQRCLRELPFNRTRRYTGLTLYTPHSTLCILHSPHGRFTPYNLRSTLCSSPSTVYSPQSTLYNLHSTLYRSHLAVCQDLVHLVNIQISGKWMFIPLNMVLIGIDTSPFYASHSTLHTLNSTLHGLRYDLHCTHYTSHFTLQTLQSTPCTLHVTVYAPFFTLRILHCRICTSKSTLRAPRSTLSIAYWLGSIS